MDNLKQFPDWWPEGTKINNRDMVESPWVEAPVSVAYVEEDVRYILFSGYSDPIQKRCLFVLLRGWDTYKVFPDTPANRLFLRMPCK
mgnify:CR=1 FL=1